MWRVFCLWICESQQSLSACLAGALLNCDLLMRNFCPSKHFCCTVSDVGWTDYIVRHFTSGTGHSIFYPTTVQEMEKGFGKKNTFEHICSKYHKSAMFIFPQTGQDVRFRLWLQLPRGGFLLWLSPPPRESPTKSHSLSLCVWNNVFLLTMFWKNRFTFRDFLDVVTWRTIPTTHWVSYIYIVQVFVQVHRYSHTVCCTIVYCVHSTFRRGSRPVVGHCSVDTAIGL